MQTTRKSFRASFVLRGDLRYHFDLVDSLGHTNGDPVTYQMSAIEDRPPYVEVRQPGSDADLPQSLHIPIVIYAADDFGVSRLTLFYKHERDTEDLGKPWLQRKLELRGEGVTNAEGQPLGQGPVPEILENFEWALGDLGLFPGDFVSYYVETEDNDAFSGHKTAKSPTYKLRLQTLSELYSKLQQQDDHRQTAIDSVLEKGKQLQEKYEQLARELKKNPEIDWKKQKEIQGAIDKQKQLSDKVQKIAEDLQHEVEKMQQDQLVSQEIAQKMDDIRKLLQDVQNDALRDYMKRLQDAMKQISPEEIQHAMQQMQVSQEEFLKRLERTKALLQQLKREQDLDALVEKLSKMLQNQEQLEKDTEKLQDEAKKSAGDSQKQQEVQKESEQKSGDQKNLADEAKKLQEELQKLAEEASKAGQKQLDDPAKQAQEQDPSGEMQEASKGLQQQQHGEAQKHQQKASKSLRSLYQQLMDAQASMSMSAQMEAAQKLAEAARKSLDVSFRQEGLTKEAPTVADYDGQGQMAEQQQALLAATGKVVNDLDQLGQKSLAVPPQITALLGEAIARMREGVSAYEKGNGVAGRAQGEEAYGVLNKAVVELSRSSASASSSCSKPGSNGQQRMDDLLGQQQQLNDATRQFKESIPNPGSLSPEERAQMSRLLGQQRSIEQDMQDVQKQSQEQRDLLGRLDKTLDEMHEVVQDMQSEHLDEETLRVQERIVSRMLDARRSLHKRDFNEKRESRTAQEMWSKGGKPLQESERMKKLRRDIERALRTGTPEEYEDLVRQYFRAIGEAQGAPESQRIP